MPRPMVPSRPRAWLRVAVLALVGVAVAGCENSARFDSNPFASNRAPRPEYTGSVAQQPGASAACRRSRCRRPAGRERSPRATAASPMATAASPPIGRARAMRDVTGSVPAHHAAAAAETFRPLDLGRRPPDHRRAAAKRWTASRASNRVPASAILQANGMRRGTALRPGQRLVIPRYVSDVARNERAAPPKPAPRLSHAQCGRRMSMWSRRARA